ncbi:hypothetical protein JZ751_029555, partial [Albula glossodonta]
MHSHDVISYENGRGGAPIDKNKNLIENKERKRSWELSLDDGNAAGHDNSKKTCVSLDSGFFELSGTDLDISNQEENSAEVFLQESDKENVKSSTMRWATSGEAFLHFCVPASLTQAVPRSFRTATVSVPFWRISGSRVKGGNLICASSLPEKFPELAQKSTSHPSLTAAK